MDAKTLDNEIIYPFSDKLSFLVQAILSKAPGDKDLELLQEKISVAQGYEPFALLDKVGPYLYKYRKEIQEANVEYFIEVDPKKLIDIENKTVDIYGIIDKIRTNWKKMKDSERKSIIKKVQEMLVIFCRYQLHRKGERN